MKTRDTIRLTTAACGAGLLLGLAACGSGEDRQAAAPVVAPPRPAQSATPPRPAVTPIDQLMAQLGIDQRVYLPEDRAPATDAERRAVLEFFDTFARGDATALKRMLSGLDAGELDELVKSGEWASTTAKISRIEVQTGPGPDGSCALAVFFVGDGFQPQLWYYHADGSSATFDAVAAPPDLMNRLHGTDWITAWFSLLAAEQELAFKPDEETTAPKRDLGDKSDRGDGYSGPESFPDSPGGPSRPTAPGGPTGRRPRPGNKRPPPGKGH